MDHAPLLVELVPASTWSWNLRSVLTRKGWDNLRKQVYEAAKHLCEVCGGKGFKHPVECHERWEYDDKNHIQKLIGLEALCPRCHEVRHLGRAFQVGNGPRALAHLIRVNRWSVDQATDHVEQAFDKWKQRSRFQWRLDLTWLDSLSL